MELVPMGGGWVGVSGAPGWVIALKRCLGGLPDRVP